MKNKFLTAALLVCTLLVSMFPAWVNADDSTIVNGKAGKTEYTLVAWETGEYTVNFETSSMFTACLIDDADSSYTVVEDGVYKIESVSLSEGTHKISFSTDSDNFALDLLNIKKEEGKITINAANYYGMTFTSTGEATQSGGTYTNYSTGNDANTSPYVTFEVVVPKSGNYKFGGVLLKNGLGYLSSWNVAWDNEAAITPAAAMLKGQLEPYNHTYFSVYEFGEVYLTSGTHYLKVTATNKRTAGNYYLKLHSFSLEFAGGGDEQPSASGGLAEVRVEGESGVLNQPLTNDGAEVTALKSSTTASGGSEIRFAVNGEYTGDGYVFDYNFEIPKSANYNMYYLGGLIGSAYVSVAEFSIDESEYINFSLDNFTQYEDKNLTYSTSGSYVKIVPLYLEEGTHNLKVRISTPRTSSQGGYCYNLDWIDFSELGFTFETESEVVEYKGYSDVVINSVLGGFKKGDIQQAVFSCESDDEYIAKYENDKIYAAGLGSTTLHAALESENEIYEASADITTVVNGFRVVETKVLNDGTKGVMVKNHADTDKTVCFVNIIRNSDGIAAEIVLEEVNVPSGATVCFSAKTVSGCTNDIFLTDSEASLAPVSNMIQF